MGIFADHAPRHWAAGLPVIPIARGEKRPVISGWQKFGEEMPSKSLQDEWLYTFADCGMGLALGAATGLVAIDLDTDDAEITAAVEALLPPTPWKRRGKKGAVYLFRDPEARTFRLKKVGGDTVVECLARGTQIIIPPTLHKDTGRPYTASAELVDVWQSVPLLPAGMEKLLRAALESMGLQLTHAGNVKSTSWVAAGARDTSMIAIAGLHARDVVRGNRSLAEAWGEMAAWVESYVERVQGDPLSVEKGQARIVEFMARDIKQRSMQLPEGWNRGLSDEQVRQVLSVCGQDSQAWDIDKVETYLQAQFQEHDRGSTGRRDAVEQVLHRIATGGMGVLDVDSTLEYIVAASAKQYTKTAMRARITQIQNQSVEGVNQTEVAKALVAELSRNSPVRYFEGHWWRWGGSHWEKLAAVEVYNVLAEEFGSLTAAKRESDHKGIEKIASRLAAGDLTEKRPVGLNFANGFLTRDLVLREHAETDGMTYTLPYLYNAENADPKRFLSFLFECWGHDPDYALKVQALREAIAVTMFGIAQQFQRAFLLYGAAGSGKSVLKDVIMGLLPEEKLCSVGPQDWDDKFIPVSMLEKLANFCGELSESKLIPGDVFKRIIDGERMTAQYKNAQVFEFSPRCAHWFASNHMPRSRDTTAGFTRRWTIFSFNKPCQTKDIVLDLAALILSEERDVIAAWAAEALPELLKRSSFTLAPSMESALDVMRGMNNSLDFFMNAPGVVTQVPLQLGWQNGSLTRIPSVPVREVFETYHRYCKQVMRAMPVSLAVFILRLEEYARWKSWVVRSDRVYGIILNASAADQATAA